MKQKRPKPIRALFISPSDTRPDAHNYMPALLEKSRVLPPGGVSHVTIRHDDWCKLLAGTGACNCEPEVSIESLH
jgi:hypothetical protein